MTTGTKPSEARMLANNLETYSQICLAVHEILKREKVMNTLLNIFDMLGLTQSLKCNGLLSNDNTGATGTGLLVLRYVYPTDSAIKESKNTTKVLNGLHPAEKAYLVSKTILEKKGMKFLPNFFKIHSLFKQLEKKGLLTTDCNVNKEGNIVAVLICRNLL